MPLIPGSCERLSGGLSAYSFIDFEALASVVSTEQMGLDGPGLSSQSGPER